MNTHQSTDLQVWVEQPELAEQVERGCAIQTLGQRVAKQQAALVQARGRAPAQKLHEKLVVKVSDTPVNRIQSCRQLQLVRHLSSTHKNFYIFGHVLVDVDAMMVHLEHAAPARRAVVGPVRLEPAALAARAHAAVHLALDHGVVRRLALQLLQLLLAQRAARQERVAPSALSASATHTAAASCRGRAAAARATRRPPARGSARARRRTCTGTGSRPRSHPAARSAAAWAHATRNSTP
ncbi:hypothetical protein ON010_g10909 [Phytophthora cinnamomi]|nr:hypothetical protein ON010_g10909 [Phytophthora cinnamomi]